MKLRAIRSMKVAQSLLFAGEHVIKIEPSEKSPGKLVFIFEDTHKVQQILNEARTKRPPL